MENIKEDEEGAFDKIKNLAGKAASGLNKGLGNTSNLKEYTKNPLAVVGFWLMTALSFVLGYLVYNANNRANEAEKLVVIERAKRDADKENYENRLDKWIKMALDATKEAGKKEQLNELNK